MHNFALIALAALTQGCQRPEPESRGAPNPPRGNQEGAGPLHRETGEIRLSRWGVGVPRPDGPVGGAAARIDGVLSRVGACLIVESEGGAKVHPVFPSDQVRWDATSGTLRFAGSTYRLGDRITLGGGGVASENFRRETGVEIAPCEISDVWVVIG